MILKRILTEKIKALSKTNNYPLIINNKKNHIQLYFIEAIYWINDNKESVELT